MSVSTQAQPHPASPSLQTDGKRLPAAAVTSLVSAPPNTAAGIHPRNEGRPLDLGWVNQIRVNLSAAERRVATLPGRRTVKKDAQAAVHMVSAFAAHQRLVLGQVKVADKSNEIVAIPKLLDLLAIEGAVVTIDAIGCQRDIA